MKCQINHRISGPSSPTKHVHQFPLDWIDLTIYFFEMKIYEIWVIYMIGTRKRWLILKNNDKDKQNMQKKPKIFQTSSQCSIPTFLLFKNPYHTLQKPYLCTLGESVKLGQKLKMHGIILVPNLLSKTQDCVLLCFLINKTKAHSLILNCIIVQTKKKKKQVCIVVQKSTSY